MRPWAKRRSSKNYPYSQRWSVKEIRLSLFELDSDDWLDDEESLTIHEKALLEARLAAYAKDPDAGSTWEKVEGRTELVLVASPTDEPASNRQAGSGG